MNIKLPQNPKKSYKKDVVISSPNDIYNLKEIKEIRSAMQECIVLVGLNSRNNVLNVSLLSIGDTNSSYINMKTIVREAVLNGYVKAILVHNHPANELTPSEHDNKLTSLVNKCLECFGVELLDHIIVADRGFYSYTQEKTLDIDFPTAMIKFMGNINLMEENTKLKNELAELKSKYIVQDNELNMEEPEYC